MAMLMPMVAALGADGDEAWQKRLLSVPEHRRACIARISTYSRGGFLAVGARRRACTSGARRTRCGRRWRRSLAIAIVLPALPPAFWDRMSHDHRRTDDERDASQLGRLHFWQVAIAMANDHPLLGVGHAATSRTTTSTTRPAASSTATRAVHSAWFGVLAELGYPGLLLFVVDHRAVVPRVPPRPRHGRARRDPRPARRRTRSASKSSLVAFVVGGSFVSFQYCEMLWHFFALTIALESVAVTEAAANRARVKVIAAPPPAATQARSRLRLGIGPIMPNVSVIIPAYNAEPFIAADRSIGAATDLSGRRGDRRRRRLDRWHRGMPR